jgi:hypothetical protein
LKHFPEGYYAIKKPDIFRNQALIEAPVGFEPTIKVLQTLALGLLATAPYKNKIYYSLISILKVANIMPFGDVQIISKIKINYRILRDSKKFLS